MFSPVDCGLAGYQALGRRFASSFVWALILFLAIAVPAGLGLWASRDMIQQMFLHDSGTEPHMRAVLHFHAVNQVMVGWTLAAQTLFVLAVEAAVMRSILRPKQPGGLFWLKFGGDELRLLIVRHVHGLLFVLFLLLGGSLVAGLAIAAHGANATLGAVVGWGGAALLVCLTIWLWVRLSLAGAISVKERRLSLFDTFATTRGRFWSLLFAYVVAGVLSVATTLLILSLTAVGVLGALAATGHLAALQAVQNLFVSPPAPETLTAAAVAGGVWIYVSLWASVVGLAVTAAPGASAVDALRTTDRIA